MYLWNSQLQGEMIDIEVALQEIHSQAPSIAAFGVSLDSLTDFKVVIEQKSIITVPSLSYAVHCCLACFYIFNISFPIEISPMMVFFEKYVHSLTPSKKLSLAASILIDNLDAIEGW